ncbi:3'-5'-exoribonuclease [Entomophthora muscae]|uniref:3'-5'-exoribonuclease n=2 Tax=Entomophthora muscae TaxID=34485 RepID=A0ACC2U6T1_9FUNG|nr:3'-5'-exoribonuclease [Entomophthora muscae]
MVFDACISENEKKFLLESLDSGLRLDGRSLYEFRKLEILPNKDIPGEVTIQLGHTRVTSKITCQVVRPNEKRQAEGVLNIISELSPIASTQFEAGRSSEEEVVLSRMLEKTLRRSKTVDLEGLCIVAGEKVWQIRLNLHFLDHGGNLIDAGSIAALAGLMHFRRPDVTVLGEEVTIHSAQEKAMIPLTLHHLPVSITFAFFNQGAFFVVDPSIEEEKVKDGQLTVSMNLSQEICAYAKPGGTPLEVDQLLQCTQLAMSLSRSIVNQLKTELNSSP